MAIDRRGLIVALGLSLVANIFLAGFVAGHVFGGRNFVHRGPGAHFALRVVPPVRIRALPEDESDAFHAAMAPHREAIRAARRAHRALRRQVEADIAAPVYDAAKVSADFRALRQASTDVQETVNAALVEALAKLSPKARADVVSSKVERRE